MYRQPGDQENQEEEYMQDEAELLGAEYLTEENIEVQGNTVGNFFFFSKKNTSERKAIIFEMKDKNRFLERSGKD